MRIQEGMKGPEATEVQVTKDVAELPPSRARAYSNEPRSYGGESRAGERPRREREPYRGPIPSGPIVATVVRMDPAGRFMFVKADTEGFDVYVHSSLFQRWRTTPREGDQVQIVVEESDRGLRARSIESI